MQKLYIGMPLLDLMSAMEDKYIKENFKENILNFDNKKLLEPSKNRNFCNELYLNIINTPSDFFYKLQGFKDCA